MNALERLFSQQEVARYLINRILYNPEGLSDEERTIALKCREGQRLEDVFADMSDDFFAPYKEVLGRSMAINLRGQEMPHYITGHYN